MTDNRTNVDQYQLRLPRGLRERIKQAAEKKGATMNAEIVRVLEDEFPEPLPLDERLSDLLVTLGTLAAQVEGESPEGILGDFTEKLIWTLDSIERGIWNTDSRTQQIASEALAKLKKRE